MFSLLGRTNRFNGMKLCSLTAACCLRSLRGHPAGPSRSSSPSSLWNKKYNFYFLVHFYFIESSHLLYLNSESVFCFFMWKLHILSACYDITLFAFFVQELDYIAHHLTLMFCRYCALLSQHLGPQSPQTGARPF